MSKAFARGACPGLSAPMQTGDGLLARLVVGRSDSARCVHRPLRRGARARQRHHGDQRARQPANSRAQFRLGARCSPRRSKTLGIDLCESVPVLSDPLPDDPTALIDSQAIAAALRQAIADAALALAPKVSVVIDGGGRIGLDALPADIRLRPPRRAKVQDFMWRSPATHRPRRKSASSRRKTRSMPCWLCSRPSPPRE